MKKTKLEKGITLIALIITIVILLTLAVVAISSASDTGIIQYAKKSVRASKKAQIEEEIINILNAMNMDIYENSKDYSATPEEFEIDEEVAMYKVLSKPVEALEENFTVDVSTITTIDADTRIFWPENLYLKGLLEVEELENGEKYIASIPCTYKEDNDVKIIVEIENSGSGVKVIRFSLGEIKPKTIAVATQRVQINIETDEGGNKKITDKNGNVLENVADVKDGVPIPKGFYYVEGTRDTGVVISDSELDENDQNGGNNGNQFVWVPVEINPELVIIVEEEKVVKDIRIISFDGYDETIKVDSNYFKKTLPIANNTMYEVIITYKDETVASKVFYVDECYENTYKVSSLSLITYLAEMSGFSEDEIFNKYKEQVLEDNPNTNVETKVDIMKEYIKTFNNTDSVLSETRNDEKASVLRYGGFYIGRYEFSNSGIKANEYPISETFTSANARIESLNDDTASVKIMLPTSAAWDAICKWFKKTRLTPYEIHVDAQSYGNHKPKIEITKPQPTPTLERTAGKKSRGVNNIYDLTGNVEEWTTEMEGANHIARGSSYKKDILITFYKRNTIESETETAGYRPMLYIK